MKNHFLSTALIIPLLVFATALIMVYPYYQYYIDPDAVAYLTISKRYAQGDFTTAINGYWSPWSCWLTALFIKQGVEAFKAAIIVNALGAAAFLTASYFLFSKFIKERVTFLLLMLTLALFLVYAVFKQSFADLWYIFFLLTSLLVMMKKQFLSKPLLWMVTGILGGLAYYAKAYAFPYFILSSLVLTAILLLEQDSKIYYKKWLTIACVSIFTMIIVSAPWIFLLYQKYGSLMTSTSGSLNLSWYLVGHPYFHKDIDLLIPPVYSDAIYYWEDPYLVNAETPHFWDSPKLFLMQIVRFGYTMLKLVNSMNELSAFFLVTTLLCLLIVSVKKIRHLFSKELYLLCISFLIFPLGYLLINFEARYLWFLVPISMVIGAVVIDKIKLLVVDRKILRLLIAVFSISYLIFPVWDMKALFRSGEKEYLVGQGLKNKKINGSFASNISEIVALQNVIKLAYFSGNSFYYMPWAPSSNNHLLKELQRYDVKYYFHFHDPFETQNILFKNSDETLFPVVFEDTSLVGLKVYQLHP